MSLPAFMNVEWHQKEYRFLNHFLAKFILPSLVVTMENLALCLSQYTLDRRLEKKICDEQAWRRIKNSENITHNEFLPGRYTDLTWVKHKHSLQYPLNHESLYFFRGFQLSELGMDILNALQVKSSEKVLGFTIWSTVKGATLCFKSEICVASVSYTHLTLPTILLV